MKARVNFPRRYFRLPILLIPVVLASVFSPVRSQASVLAVSLSPLGSVAAGSTGNNFDVLLTNTSGAGVSIGGFFFEVLSGSPDLTFTDATTATATSYIFSGSSLFGPDIMSKNTGLVLDASDLGSGTLASGATHGLGHVLFNASPTAPTELVNLTLSAFPATSLADPSGANLPINSSTGGRIQINGRASAVPEPFTLSMMLAGLCFLWIGKSLRFGESAPRVVENRVRDISVRRSEAREREVQ